MQYDETRLAGTYGSDIPEDEDIGSLENDIDYDFDMDEPLLWMDEIDNDSEDFPF